MFTVLPRFFLVLILLFSGVVSAAAQRPVSGKALDRDAFLYAQQFHVPIAEARQRLQWQVLAGELEEKISDAYPESFSGLWIEHAPSFRVVVLLTEPEPARGKLELMVSQGPLSGKLEVRRAVYGLKTLREQKTQARLTMQRSGIEADIDIDVRANRVVLYTLNSSRAESALQGIRRQLPEGLSVVEVDELAVPTANIYGGLPSTDCTWGFSVVDASGNRGISTAGHCGSFQVFSGSVLPFRGECYRDNFDVQWHSVGSHTAQPWIKVGSQIRSIYSTTPRVLQSINAYVCKEGRTSGTTCGTIRSKNFAPSYVPSVNATFILVGGSRTALSVAGDSGGPWFLANSAYGINSGRRGNEAIYMAIDFISCLNVSVLTTTPPPPPPPPSCEEYCGLDYADCQVDFCYWDYDPYMCYTGCDLELDQCLSGC